MKPDRPRIILPAKEVAPLRWAATLGAEPLTARPRSARG